MANGEFQKGVSQFMEEGAKGQFQVGHNPVPASLDPSQILAMRGGPTLNWHLHLLPPRSRETDCPLQCPTPTVAAWQANLAETCASASRISQILSKHRRQRLEGKATFGWTRRIEFELTLKFLKEMTELQQEAAELTQSYGTRRCIDLPPLYVSQHTVYRT